MLVKSKEDRICRVRSVWQQKTLMKQGSESKREGEREREKERKRERVFYFAEEEMEN